MARPSSRVVLNRAALSQLDLAVAEGVEEIARTIVEVADPPDAEPYGVGLVKRGGWAVYDGGKKVGGGSLDGSQPNKPKAFRTPPGDIHGIAGFGFPARFQETGTVKQPARPWLWRTVIAVSDHAGRILAEHIRHRMGTRP